MIELKQTHKRFTKFVASDFLKDVRAISFYLDASIADGDISMLTKALRTARDALGGAAAMATKTELSKESLNRSLSAIGNLRLNALVAILHAFGLR